MHNPIPAHVCVAAAREQPDRTSYHPTTSSRRSSSQTPSHELSREQQPPCTGWRVCQPVPRSVTPRRHRRKDVVVAIEIVHRDRFDRDTDEREVRCLHDMESALRDLGACPRSWRGNR